MPRRCGHDTELEPGKPYEAGQCYVCWVYHNDKTQYALWEGQAVKPQTFRDTGRERQPCKCRQPKA